MIRKATGKDIEAITSIYDQILEMEEWGLAHIGWQRGVYPTRDTALAALGRGDLFVNEEDGVLAAAAIINHTQMDSYARGHWKREAKGDEVMALHTLVVAPSQQGRGCGRHFVSFYEQYAREHGCTDLRMDTQEQNLAARDLYHQLGYEEVGVVPCDFNGIEGISLVLLEKVLRP